MTVASICRAVPFRHRSAQPRHQPVLASPHMQLALENLRAEAAGGSPQDFSGLLRDEAPQWIEMMQSSGLKIN